MIENLYTTTRHIKVIYKDASNSISEEHDIDDAKVAISTNADSFENIDQNKIVRVFFFLNKNDESSCFEFDPFSQSISFSKDEISFTFVKKIRPLNKTQEIHLYFDNENNDKLDNILHRNVYDVIKG